MSERRAEVVTPKPLAGQRLGVFVSTSTIELLAQLVDADFKDDALAILRSLRNGQRRLEPDEVTG